jgi:hypothetical protein
MAQRVTDVSTIERLTHENEDENWRFRCFLKAADLGVAKLDAIVRELHREVAGDIDCQTCGNCCRVMRPVLSEKDVSRLARARGMSKAGFTAAYLEADEGGGRSRFLADVPPWRGSSPSASTPRNSFPSS